MPTKLGYQLRVDDVIVIKRRKYRVLRAMHHYTSPQDYVMLNLYDLTRQREIAPTSFSFEAEITIGK